MSKLWEDRWNGRPIRVVYGGDGDVDAPRSSRFARAASLRSLARRWRGGHAARVSGDGAVTLLYRHAGISIEAQLVRRRAEIARMLADAGAAAAMIVVPGEREAYAALVDSSGVVEAEEVAPPSELTLGARANAVYLAAGEGTGEKSGIEQIALPGEYAPLPAQVAVSPWDRSAATRPLWRVMTSAGLPHPAQGLAAMLAAAVVLTGWAGWSWMRAASAPPPAAFVPPPPPPPPMRIPAADLLADVGTLAWTLSRYDLSRDQAAELVYDRGTATLTGSWAAGYPARAEWLAEDLGGSVRLAADGWEATLPRPLSPAPIPPAAHPQRAVLDALFLGAAASGGTLSVSRAGGRATAFTLTAPPDALGRFAAHLAGFPATVAETRCRYQGGRLETCTVAGEVGHGS